MKSRYIILLSVLLLNACGQEEPPVRLLGQVDCRVEACELRTEAFNLALQLPAAIKPLAPFVAELQLETTLPVESVLVDFIMPGMDMGRNQYRFSRIDRQGVWRAEPTLPVCVTGRSDWRADVEIVADGVVYEARFDFEIIN